MAEKPPKNPIYITNFCSYIDTLLELYCNWPEVEGNALHCGSPANFLAVRLGLTSSDGPFPYDRDIWSNTVFSSERKCDKNYINQLKKWKKRARALPKNTKLYTPELEIKINRDDIRDFCDIARQTKRLCKEMPSDDYGFIFENNVYENMKTQIQVNLKTLDTIALQLGFVDPAWHFMKQLEIYLVSEEDYEKVGIDINCNKFPSDYYNEYNTSDLSKKLSELIEKAKALQNSDQDNIIISESVLITQTEASRGFGIPKATLAKYAKHKIGEVNYLWSKKKGRNRYYKRKDIEKLAQSRELIAFHQS